MSDRETGNKPEGEPKEEPLKGEELKGKNQRLLDG